MNRGQLFVRRVEDVVVVVQDGFFANGLMERMFELVEAAHREAVAAHGRCMHLVDSRTFTGSTLSARFRCEQWVAALQPPAAGIAMITHPQGFLRRLQEISALLVPRLPLRFVPSELEAIRILESEPLAGRILAALAEAPRRAPAGTGDPADPDAH